MGLPQLLLEFQQTGAAHCLVIHGALALCQQGEVAACLIRQFGVLGNADGGLGLVDGLAQRLALGAVDEVAVDEAHLLGGEHLVVDLAAHYVP